MKRSWPLGVVLSLTQDRLACNFGDVQEFVEWMLGEPVWTLGVGAAVEPVRAHILTQRPDLADVTMPDVVAAGGERDITAWLRRMAVGLGSEVELEPLPADTFSAGGFVGELSRFAKGVRS